MWSFGGLNRREGVGEEQARLMVDFSYIFVYAIKLGALVT